MMGWGRALRAAGTCAALAAIAVSTPARAQPSDSRADVQFGAVLLHTAPGLVMGGTGWIGEHAGVAARVYSIPGLPRLFEIGVRARGFTRGATEDIEVDFGMSLMALKAEESVAAPIRRSEWHRYLMMDALLGRRLGERFGLKVGAGLAFYGHGAGIGFSAKCLAVVPLGGL